MTSSSEPTGGPKRSDGRGEDRVYPRVVELLLYGVSPLATLITAPLLARGLGPEARGQFGVAMAVGMFALTLAAWGQPEVYLSEARAGRRGFSTQSRIIWVGGAVVGVLTAGTLLMLDIPADVAVLTAIWVPLLAQSNLWRSVSVAFGDLRRPALFTAAAPVFRVAILLLLVQFAVLNLDTAVTATQIASAIAAFCTVWLVARGKRNVSSLPPVRARLLLRRGGSLITFSVLNAITLRSDLVILQIFASSFDVGLYAAPASLTTAALALSNGFKARLQSAAVSRGNSTTVARESLPVLVLGLIGAALLWFLAPFLVGLFFGSEYEGSIGLLRILGVATVPLLMLDLAQGVLIVIASRARLIRVGIVGAAAVVLALSILCPLFGATGAAVACVLGYTAAAVSAWAILLKTLKDGEQESPAV